MFVVVLTLSGCAGKRLTRQTVTVSGPGRVWEINLTVLSSVAGFCTFGPIDFFNNGADPLGGTIALVVTNETKSVTRGEVIASCATAFPKGVSRCTSDRPISYNCRGAIITARPLALR